MHSALRRALIPRGVFQPMALTTSKITAAKYPTAAAPAPQARKPLPVAAEPGGGVAEGHELVDADPLALWVLEPIEKTDSIRLSNNADRAGGLTPTCSASADAPIPTKKPLLDDFGQYRAVISSAATNMRHVFSGFEVKSAETPKG